MSSEGFSTLLIFFVVLAVLALLFLVPGAISRSSRQRDIKKQIDSLNIQATLKDEQCTGGDGIDSGAQCRYVYSDKASSVETALANAGYTYEHQKFTEAGGITMATLVGGNPKLRIQYSLYQGTTTLDVGRAN